MNYSLSCFDKSRKTILLRSFKKPNYKCLENVIPSKNDINVKEIITNVFIALNKLYENGEFHGCLNPKKILINEENNNIILKNYCLYMIENNEKIKQEIKNEEFLCPELMKGEKLNKKSDIWCFGKLIEYLLRESGNRDKYLEEIMHNCLKEDINERMNIELLEKSLFNEDYRYIISEDKNKIINELVKDKGKFDKLVDDYLKMNFGEIDFFFVILGVLLSLNDEKLIEEYKQKFLKEEWFKWLGGIFEDSNNYYIFLKSVRHSQINCFIRSIIIIMFYSIDYPLTSFGLSEISKFSKYLFNLEIFKCRSNEIGDNGLISLCDCFSNLTNLRSLDISDNGISDIGINKLVNSFDKIRKLDTLIIDKCKIHSYTFKNYCENLRKLDNLIILSMCYIKLSKEDIILLNKSLINLPRLTNLSLMNCGLKQNVVELKEAISHLKESEYRPETPKVDLDSNEIDDASLIEIYEYLMAKKPIHQNYITISISMNNNLITKQALKKLRKYRKRNKGKLYLSCNSFENDDFYNERDLRGFVDIESISLI